VREAEQYDQRVREEAEKRLSEQQSETRFERDVARQMQSRQLPSEPRPSEGAVRAERVLPAPVAGVAGASPPAERQQRSARGTA
jgi:hypothetical protein